MNAGNWSQVIGRKAGALVMIAFCCGLAACGESREENAQRASAVKYQEIAKARKEEFIAKKYEYIAAALAKVSDDPAAGLKALEPYESYGDPDVKDTNLKLNQALRAKRIEQAKRHLLAGDSDAAFEEVLAYQGLSATPEITKLLGEIGKVRQKRDAANEKLELAARRKEGVKIGMTAERVLQSSWGKPESVNRTIRANGVHEQWVYRGSHSYLYFDNGTLTSIQN